MPVAGEEAVARLSALLSQLQGVRGLRPVPPHQLHFTLKFFEDLPDPMLPSAKGAAARAAAGLSSFSLSLSGLGTFPPRGPARVLWVGAAEGSAQLALLASAVEKEFALEGFTPETRLFSAHLTLARVREPRASHEAVRFAASSPAFDGGTTEVRELVLYQSVLGPGGAAHSPLGRFPLAPR